MIKMKCNYLLFIVSLFLITTIKPVMADILTLKTGWNTIPDYIFFSEVRTQCDIQAIFGYDNGWKGEWETFDSIDLSDSTQNRGAGYFVNVAGDCNIDYTMPAAVPGLDYPITLKQGWNLITGVRDTQILKASENAPCNYYKWIYHWDKMKQDYDPLLAINQMQQGEVYWVYVWEVGCKLSDGTRSARSTRVFHCVDGTPEGQCSSFEKPKYCINGRLIYMCSACSCPEGQCQMDGTCTSASTPSYCKPFQLSGKTYVKGDHESKIDIVFILQPSLTTHDEKSFKFLIYNNYLHPLFSEDPLNKYEDKFNIYYVTDPAKDCEKPKTCKLPSRLSECSFADIKAVVFPTYRGKSNIELPIRPSYLIDDNTMSALSGAGFAHLLGHALFGLPDEYCCYGEYYQNYPYPSLFKSREECETYVKEQNLASGCEQVCLSGSLPGNIGIGCIDWYRVSGNSIMYTDIKSLGLGNALPFIELSENNKLRINWFLNNFENIL